MPSILNATTTTGLVSSGDNSGSLQLATNNGTAALTIDTSQNVGIGTASPLNVSGYASLSINGTTSGLLEIQSSGTQRGVFFYDGSLTRLRSAGILVFDTNGGNERMRIDTSGNIGIGVTPSAWRTAFGQKSIQFGPVGFVYSLSASSTNNQTFLGSNWFLNSSGNPTYINSDYALNYSQSFGIHNWATAPQGTAGNTFSFTDVMQIDASANLKFNSGYGSAATAYGCRAWVNFNGTSTVAIRSSGNVSSITDNGSGDYTVNLTTAMPDGNYSAVASGGTGGNNIRMASCAPVSATSTSQIRVIGITINASALIDLEVVSVAIFR